MPNTYTELRQTVVGTATSSVTLDLTGISGYTDLMLVINGIASGDAGCRLQFNGDTGTNYSSTYMYAIYTTSGVQNGRDVNATVIGGLGRLGTSPGTAIINIQNYSNTTTNKTVLAKGGTTDIVMTTVGLWRSIAAITSMVVSLENSRTFSTGTTLSLYGIAAAPVPVAKATGGTIYYGADGYVYHKFTSSGTFTPSSALTADILVVGGGGGGATSVGGGGGGGGLLGFSSQALTATGYTVTVGSGGAAVGSNSQGNTGNDSRFGALTLVKGGGGGGSYAAGTTGKNGGSGGGAGGWAPPATGGSFTTDQGFAGGNVTGGTYGAGGSAGGGGAGGAGGTYSTGTVGSSGGRGSAAYSSWGLITSSGVAYNGEYYFAAGGPGVYGFGGSQATASFGAVAFGAAVATNTGQGGSGDYGYAGSDGIVIVRYLA
jgi:hypothetical protein